MSVIASLIDVSGVVRGRAFARGIVGLHRGAGRGTAATPCPGRKRSSLDSLPKPMADPWGGSLLSSLGQVGLVRQVLGPQVEEKSLEIAEPPASARPIC